MSIYDYSCMDIASNRLIIETKSSPTHTLSNNSFRGSISQWHSGNKLSSVMCILKNGGGLSFPLSCRHLSSLSQREKKEKRVLPHICKLIFFLSLALPAALSVEQESECLHVETFSEIQFWRAEECCGRNVLPGHLKVVNCLSAAACAGERRKNSNLIERYLTKLYQSGILK